MAFEVRFPAVYERISPYRTPEEVERELNRRCGYMDPTEIAPAKFVDQAIDPRAGTKWERSNAPKQKKHEPLPPKQDRKTCSHEHGLVGGGVGREKCRACGLTRVIGRSWKRLVPLRKSKSVSATA